MLERLLIYVFAYTISNVFICNKLDNNKNKTIHRYKMSIIIIIVLEKLVFYNFANEICVAIPHVLFPIAIFTKPFSANCSPHVFCSI